MDTYVLANQKGGVGKTTIALGVASALARRRVGALLIDLDPQASTPKVLGIDTDERCTIADALLGPEHYPLAETIVGTDWGARRRSVGTALASPESRRSTADEFVLLRQLEQRAPGSRPRMAVRAPRRGECSTTSEPRAS